MFHQRLLQRYMPGDIATKTLNDDGFYFRRINGYPKDRTEGDREYFGKNESLILSSLNSRFSKTAHMTKEEGAELCKKIVQRDKKGIFIQSWFWHRQMSRFMWEEYAKSSKSPDCALFIVDLIKLGNYLDKTLPVGYQFEPVNYIEDKLQQREAVFSKNLEFQPEHEYRISIDIKELMFFNKKILPEISWPPRHMDVYCEDDLSKHYRNGGIASEHNFKYVDEYGLILKAPLPELLESVFIPTNAGREFSLQLDNILDSKGYDFKCQRIDLPTE
ncbi:hypothetical protein [Pseudomonas sp. MYb118]|uniref:hypothetical protein n=1 Tax=Pseudomonas sp. MYb118 TaxID=1848720 RepID=UPI0034CD5B16